MSGLTATLDIDDAPIHAILAGLRAVEPNLFEPLGGIGEAMVSSTTSRFSEQRGPDGQAWVPSEAAKKRAKKGGVVETLIATTRLLRSFTSEVTGESVEWGTNVPYAPPHQFGATIAHQAFAAAERQGFALPFTDSIVVLPARPFVGVNDDDYDTMREILVGFLGRLVGVNDLSGGAA